MYELSLFTGAGGGLLGTHLLGWTPVGYVEWNDYCQRIIAARIADGILPNAPIFGDIKTFISSGYAASYTGLVDVVTAGFPCQPFSVAGQRKAAADNRNMWPETIEVIRLVKPNFIFLENVPGLLSSGYAATVVNDLQRADYQVLPPLIIGANDVGAPHKRDRVWFLAYTHSSRLSRPDAIQSSNDRQRHDPARQQAGNAEQGVIVADCEDVAHAYGQRLPIPWAIGGEQEIPRAKPRSDGGDWWATEPDVGRVAHGVASRVDRLKAVGNGQVPAVVRAAWELLTGGLI